MVKDFSIYKGVLISLGIIFVAIASVLAIVWRWDHFYELMLLGLLCISTVFIPKGALTVQRVFKLYIFFLFAGLIVDLLLGLLVTQAWHYAYTTPLEYVILYVWIYPAGGFVLTESYLIARTFFHETPAFVRIDRKLFWTVFITCGAATLIVVLLREIIPFSLWGYLLEVTAICTLCSMTALRCEFRGKPSYLRDLISSPRQTIIATCLATFSNLLIHEYPNVYAHEWVYRFGTPLLGIPLAIWIEWPLLTIGSISLYYRTDEGKNVSPNEQVV